MQKEIIIKQKSFPFNLENCWKLNFLFEKQKQKKKVLWKMDFYSIWNSFSLFLIYIVLHIVCQTEDECIFIKSKQKSINSISGIDTAQSVCKLNMCIPEFLINFCARQLEEGMAWYGREREIKRKIEWIIDGMHTSITINQITITFSISLLSILHSQWIQNILNQ